MMHNHFLTTVHVKQRAQFEQITLPERNPEEVSVHLAEKYTYTSAYSM